MKQKRQDAVPLRVKVCTVLSGVILAAVCSMEVIDAPWKNEWWVGILALTLLAGCMLLLWWSFGGFDRNHEN
nr:hypothetical protein [Clostridia bacterium]